MHFFEQLIDIGRCTGTCSAIERCVVRSKRKNSLLQSTAKCLMALETNDVTCVAKRVHAVKYTSVEGKVVQVMQVRRCGCSWRKQYAVAVHWRSLSRWCCPLRFKSS